MSKFRFRVCRDYTKSVMVTVQADTIQEAHNLACDNPDAYADEYLDWGGAEPSWRNDDNTPGPAYIPDESDFEIIDRNWNARNQHQEFTREKWVTAIRMYRTEKSYHDWVEDELAHGGIE